MADRLFLSNWSALSVSPAKGEERGWLGSIHRADFRTAGFLGTLPSLLPKPPSSPPRGYQGCLASSANPYDCVRRSFHSCLALVSWLSPSGALLVDRRDPRETLISKVSDGHFCKEGNPDRSPKEDNTVPAKSVARRKSTGGTETAASDENGEAAQFRSAAQRGAYFCAQQVSVSITITRLRFGKRLISWQIRDDPGFTVGLLALIRNTNNCNPRGALDEPKPL